MKFFNAKIKYYDDTHFKITTYNYQNRCDFEKTENKNDDSDYSFVPGLNDIIDNTKRSIISSHNRAKNMIYDYARSNDFDYFVTLTFNPELVDSFNYFEVSQKLSQWLNNVKKRYALDFKYLFVPELHKSGRYHFHGLIGNIGTLRLVDSGMYTPDGKRIYNLGNYRMGFTTATAITDKQRTATYIGKYITKELSGHIKGKKHYWVSRNLNLPREEILTVEDLNEMGIDKDFLENNSLYSKSVDYEVNGQQRKVSYYEFEWGKE